MLGDDLSVAAGHVIDMPEVLSNVRQSIGRFCESCITIGGRFSSTSRKLLKYFCFILSITSLLFPVIHTALQTSALLCHSSTHIPI